MEVINNYMHEDSGTRGGRVIESTFVGEEKFDKKVIAAAAASLRNLAREANVRRALAQKWQVVSVLVDLVSARKLPLRIAVIVIDAARFVKLNNNPLC